jgi:hypothetical protein
MADWTLAGAVGGHQVGRELHAGERTAHDLREGLHGERLGHTGHALEQQVSLGQQPDQHPLHQPVLADDDPLDLEHGSLEQLGIPRRRAGGGRFAPRPVNRLRRLGH